MRGGRRGGAACLADDGVGAAPSLTRRRADLFPRVRRVTRTRTTYVRARARARRLFPPARLDFQGGPNPCQEAALSNASANVTRYRGIFICARVKNAPPPLPAPGLYLPIIAGRRNRCRTIKSKPASLIPDARARAFRARKIDISACIVENVDLVNWRIDHANLSRPYRLNYFQTAVLYSRIRTNIRTTNTVDTRR